MLIRPRLLCALALMMGACAGAAPRNPDGAPPSGSGGSTPGVDRHSDLAPPAPPCEICEDWPVEAQIDPGTPDDAPSKFGGDPPTSGGPCITEPENGAMFPKN